MTTNTMTTPTNSQTDFSGEIKALSSDFYKVLKFKKGDYVYLPDEKCDKVYFLEEGRVITGAFSDEGKMMVKIPVVPGNFFGETGLIGREIQDDFAMAKGEATVWVFELSNLRRILQSNPNLYLHLINSIGRRLIKTEKRLESMVFKNSRARIIEFLYNLAKEQGQRVGYETLVRNFFTHQEIADLTGTSRQTVTTTLNELRNNNVITFNRRRLLVRDLGGLFEAIS